MTLDNETLQEVIRVPSTEQTEQKKKIDNVQTELEKIFDFKYAKLSRFTAKNLVGEVNQIINITDSFINENETQANNFLREASKYIKAGEDAQIHPNDPYLKAIREMRGALWNIFVSLNYRDRSFWALVETQQKLLSIIESTKDVELEGNKLEAEKKLYDTVINTLTGQIKTTEERSATREKMLMEKLLQLSGAIQRVESKVSEIDKQTDKQGQIEEESPEQELPEGELTDIEKTVLRTTKTKRRAIEYLTKRHPMWKNSTIAKLLNVDENYVSQYKPLNTE